ncbi:MAG: ABC transporter permease [Defluviitaleaceae bacterium]|nr:ABC transporter permease [Defluviitaleaceae bacterium]
MNNFMVFLAKEFSEMWRTWRIFILGIIFIFFALLSPILTRYMNDLFQMMGIFMPLPPPHWSQSYMSLYVNLNQVGMIALILLVMGVVSSEKRRGTAALMMVKGLSHHTFILAKFAALSLITFAVLLVTVLITHFLTIALFGAGADITNLLTGLVLYQIFAMMMLSLIILASTIADSTGLAAVLGFLGFMALSIPASLPRIREAFPYTISFRAHEVTAGYFSGMLWANITTAIAATALLLLISIHILRKKEL